MEFLRKEKETVDGLRVLLLELVISWLPGDTLLVWGKGEGGASVVLEIWELMVSLLCTEEVENCEEEGREEEYSGLPTSLLSVWWYENWFSNRI